MNKDDIIVLAHGGGGKKSRQLIERIILDRFDTPLNSCLDDSALLKLPSENLAFTTDSYVVQPLFFPGGDIGKLAACGTINDLAMQGARPLFISLGLILEEGFPIDSLEQILESFSDTLVRTGVKLVTGDTKVIERRGESGVFINTSGIGV